jgi:O-antigen ligase
MRRIAKLLLLLFAFAIPWEFSLNLGEPWGPVARIAGVLLLLAVIPAVLQAGRVRAPSALIWAVLALFVWFCCTAFWAIEPVETLAKLRAYFQEMMIAWLVWELADSARDLRALLRAYVAGSWVLAATTLASFASPDAVAGQLRFVAEGIDPNDAARFLVLGFPLAAVLLDGERNWAGRALALGYIPLGLLAVLLTASREGFIAAVVALVGCAVLLGRGHPRRVLAGTVALPALVAALWLIVPQGTLERLGTITEQLQGGTLNDRLNIWTQGWDAFARAPWFGSGAGSCVAAAGTSGIDTAHNTALSILVGGGLCALFLFVLVVALSVRSLRRITGPMRLALATSLLVWAITSMTATVEENRTTWLLFGLIAAAGRLAAESPGEMEACFPRAEGHPALRFQAARAG